MTTANYSQRERTTADRRAFLLSENAIALSQSAMDEQARIEQESLKEADYSSLADTASAERRKRTVERAIQESATREAFHRLVGETVFRALPLDDSEKAPFHETVLQQTTELVVALGTDWNLSPFGTELIETAKAIVESTSDVGFAGHAAVLTENLHGDTDVNTMIDGVASQIMERVVAAVVASQEKAQHFESVLAETAGDDPELVALRQRRALKENVPTIIESLFIANSRIINENTESAQVSADLLMAEAVCQYTLLETLCAVGIMQLSPAEATIMAERLQKTR